MEVNDQLIEHLAHLARLDFSGAEKVAMRRDLEKMIGFVAKLNELDTANVVPASFMSNTTDALREDQPRDMLSAEAALAPAVNRDHSFFKVPKVIRK